MPSVECNITSVVYTIGSVTIEHWVFVCVVGFSEKKITLLSENGHDYM